MPDTCCRSTPYALDRLQRITEAAGYLVLLRELLLAAKLYDAAAEVPGVCDETRRTLILIAADLRCEALDQRLADALAAFPVERLTVQ